MAPIRAALGVRTVFNIMGPLVNPAQPPLHVIGAYSLEVARLMADTLAGHPLPVMLDDGLLVTVNSDDPAYFGGYIDANYQAIREQCGITPGQLETLALNSFDASFVDDSRRQAWKQEVRAAFATE